MMERGGRGPQWIKNTRKKLGLTQAQLAKRLRVSANTVWRWEA